VGVTKFRQNFRVTFRGKEVMDAIALLANFVKKTFYQDHVVDQIATGDLNRVMHWSKAFPR